MGLWVCKAIKIPILACKVASREKAISACRRTTVNSNRIQILLVLQQWLWKLWQMLSTVRNSSAPKEIIKMASKVALGLPNWKTKVRQTSLSKQVQMPKNPHLATQHHIVHSDHRQPRQLTSNASMIPCTIWNHLRTRACSCHSIKKGRKEPQTTPRKT